jgi:hypothetical protein
MSLGHHVHVAYRFQQEPEFIARELFIIHDYGRKSHDLESLSLQYRVWRRVTSIRSSRMKQEAQ